MLSLVKTVEDSAAEGGIGPRDSAALNLALSYAASIDEGGDLTKLGPALLAALEALQLTPRARAAAVKGGPDDKPTSRLDQLASRRARKSRAEDLDAAVS